MLTDSHRHGNSNIKIIRWNVHGINRPLKRGKVYAHLLALKTDVGFLPETHIKNTAAKVLRP